MRTLEPKKPLKFEITELHCKLADKFRGQPCFCVIAQALSCLPGVVNAVVNPTITTLFMGSGNNWRFMTPKVLRDALDNWDNNKDWELPAGLYQLSPVCKTKRLAYMKKFYHSRKKAGDPNSSGNRKFPLRRKTIRPRSLGNLLRARQERKFLESQAAAA